MNISHVPQVTEQAVLAVLSGRAVADTAARSGIDPDELGDAVVLYRIAGARALADQVARRDWHQARIEFADFGRAEDTAAASLAPRLRMLEEAGLLGAWWFIRKAPCWRLRLFPAPDTDPAHLHRAVHELLGALVESREILRWWPTVYEPEVIAFGGPDGIAAAHRLFHADSRHLLDRTRHVPGLGRRERSVLLCTVLLGSAGLEWFEQGDVWDRVAGMRPLPDDITAEQLGRAGTGLRRLLTLGTRPLTAAGEPLEPLAPWLTAFADAGRAIATAARHGTLRRGPREVLAPHVIFHWNRHGLTARTQATLAAAARAVILAPAMQG
ncbi:thiopeptide-type bacteriocin biosynthesis protein [Streptomyces lavendulae]|uniref:thiopeptide-type bacteriocin biosynthesis protein n=1 Tax=Streptomyces lavendulae TaxID=1914 RepID=UPI0036E8CD6B